MGRLWMEAAFLIFHVNPHPLLHPSTLSCHPPAAAFSTHSATFPAPSSASRPAGPEFGEGLILSAASLQLRHGDPATGSSTGSALTTGPTLHSLGLNANFLTLGSGAAVPSVPVPDKPRPVRIIVSDVKALCTLELRDAFIAVFMHLGSAFTTGLTRRGKVRRQNVEAVRAAAEDAGAGGSGGAAGRRSAASSTVPDKPLAAILAEEFELLRQIKEQSEKERSAAAAAAAEAAMQEGRAGEEEEDSPR